jgi:hypothetical protein
MYKDPEGNNYKAIVDHPRGERADVIKTVAPEEIEKHVLYTYLIGHHDANEGNFLIHEGRMYGIDKDPSLSQGLDDSTRFVYPSFLFHLAGNNGGDYQFSDKIIKESIRAGESIAARLRKMSQPKDAVGVENRTEALKEFLRVHPNELNLKNLVLLGSGLDILHNRTGKHGISYKRG